MREVPQTKLEGLGDRRVRQSKGQEQGREQGTHGVRFISRMLGLKEQGGGEEGRRQLHSTNIKHLVMLGTV